uniref:Putative secreted protein n=1 Tax=Amblyomma triste TaxID=251400 RepID=A0A023G2Z0_AMBTT
MVQLLTVWFKTVSLETSRCTCCGVDRLRRTFTACTVQKATALAKRRKDGSSCLVQFTGTYLGPAIAYCIPAAR